MYLLCCALFLSPKKQNIVNSANSVEVFEQTRRLILTICPCRCSWIIVLFPNSLVKVMTRNARKVVTYMCIMFESEAEMFGEKRLPLAV
jgi:hypothetical protein